MGLKREDIYAIKHSNFFRLDGPSSLSEIRDLSLKKRGSVPRSSRKEEGCWCVEFKRGPKVLHIDYEQVHENSIDYKEKRRFIEG